MNFNLLYFERCPYDNDFWPISLGDLNLILGAWNGQEIAAKVAIGFFPSTKVFENTVFGYVTEVPHRVSNSK